jgi:hypothetical protein
MGKKVSAQRRNFLKMTAAGTACLATAKLDNVFAATKAAWPATGTMEINSNISNLRVVCCHDSNMITTFPFPSAFTGQNNSVNGNTIKNNLDQMAQRLAQSTANPTPTIDQAWRLIFRSGKTWANTKVAIKVNCIEPMNMVRVAIVQKICTVLAGFGVPPANIIIYDGCHNANPTANPPNSLNYGPYFSLTDITKTPAVASNLNGSLQSGGAGQIKVAIPGLTGTFSCTGQIADGTVDILVNCAINKGHNDTRFGGFTACMKNHFGTFNPTEPGSFKGLGTPGWLGINKSDAIVGGTPYARQQLCIVDTLAGSLLGPTGAPPDTRFDRIIMGTFGPAVDYALVKNIREALPVPAWTHNNTVVNAILTNFGYPAGTVPTWVEFAPTSVVTDASPRTGNGHSFQVNLSNPSFNPASAQFSFPANRGPLQVRIFDMKGSVVREINASSSATSLSWDGRTSGGSMVSAGNYIVKVLAGSFEQAANLLVSK